MAQSASDSITTIILDDSDHAKNFNSAELVHKTEFYATLNFINSALKLAEKEPGRMNLHNTITLSGSRGSGKTSFLLSIVKWIKDEKKDNSRNIELSSLQVLEIIDPTLIEEKGHVFLNVISLITDLVEKKLDKNECDPSDNNSPITRKEWRSSLNKLAAGLPSIDGIGPSNTDNWQDPEFVMDNGLKAVRSAQKLAENFKVFLELSLKVLKKSAFLLIFDDIDVDASKGWTVLETIRKYFTSSTLITLLSGDLELYTTVVRQKKWQNFGKEILKYEGIEQGRLSEFNRRVTKLESQYLQKILQPKYRVHLLSIGEYKLYNPDKQIYVYRNTKSTPDQHDEKYEVKNLYTQILKSFGVVNKYQAEGYYIYLLGLPLRTQIQFLSLFELPSGKYLTEGNVNSISLTDVFLSDLNSSAIDINTAVNNPKTLNRIILKFLLKEKKLEELYQLQPITTNYSLNASLLSLNFLLSFNIENDPYLIFDYFIKIGYIRNLLPSIPYRKSHEGTLVANIEDLCDNSIVINDNVLKDITGKITAYLRGAISTETISKAGTIPLYGEASTSKGDSESMSDRIDRVLKDKKADFIEHMMVYMPLSSNQYVLKQSSLLTYSAYLLLGAIGELIRKVKLDDVENGFSELSQLRAYVMPDFKAGSSDTSGEANPEPQHRPKRKEGDMPIEKLFSDWVGKFSKNKISPHLLGKISTRFFFALTAIENNIRGRKLGEVFHAHIVALMNAILIEDYRENTAYASELTLSNTNFSNNNFIYNLEAILEKRADMTKVKSADQGMTLQEFEEKIGFSKWLLSCPLLLAYLRFDNESKLKKNITDYCELDENNEIFDLNISKFLDEISVRNKDNLSMNRPSDYSQISALLAEQGINLSKLFSRGLNHAKSALKEIGVVSVTAKSIEKYSKQTNTSYKS